MTSSPRSCCRSPNRAQRRLKSPVKAACAPLGALWISYSLQAAIITTTNKRALSRVLFCSSSRLFQSVIRILLLSSSSPAPFVCLQFFLHLYSHPLSSLPSSSFHLLSISVSFSSSLQGNK